MCVDHILIQIGLILRSKTSRRRSCSPLKGNGVDSAKSGFRPLGHAKEWYEMLWPQVTTRGHLDESCGAEDWPALAADHSQRAWIRLDMVEK